MSDLLQDIIHRRRELQAIYDYLPHFGMDNNQPPVINATIVESSEKSLGNEISAKHRIDLARHPIHFQPIPGSRIFRDNVKNDIDQLDKFIARHTRHELAAATTCSTNAPYLIAIWNELARAAVPVTCIDKPLNVTSKERETRKSYLKSPGAKVDIIADNGKRWIRVNTIKNSRLLAEFMEQDSYLTDSESEEGHGDTHACVRELDNSLIEMGKILIAAAKEQPVESVVPRVTLRLTRLQFDAESSTKLQKLGLKIVGSPQLLPSNIRENDPRISQTIEELLRMGIDVVLGEHEFVYPPQSLQNCEDIKQILLVASRNINLDLSVLIALISDITHAPLPTSKEEAHMRFIPIPSERERSRRRRERQKQLRSNSNTQHSTSLKRTESQANTSKAKLVYCPRPESNGGTNTIEEGDKIKNDFGESIHSRALAKQAIGEMKNGLIDEILLVLGEITTVPVRFWVSEEVRARCLRIVAKIGGPSERRRAGALLARIGSSSEASTGVDAEVRSAMRLQYATFEEASAAYWEGSRHCHDRIGGLVPLSLFSDDGPIIDDCSASERSSDCTILNNPFWSVLATACQDLLGSGSISHPRTLVDSSTSGTESEIETKPATNGTSSDDGSGEDEIVRAAVTRANPRLTVHTVRTLAVGARARWTTLTANRAAIREVIRESKRVNTFLRSDDIQASAKTKSEKPRLMDQWKEMASAGVVEAKKTEEEIAAIWIVEPRSLAETMRGDYVPIQS